MRIRLAREQQADAVAFTGDQVSSLARAAALAVGGSRGVKALCAIALELCDASEAWVLLDEDVVAHASVHPGPKSTSLQQFPFVHGRQRGALVLIDATTTSVAPALCELIATALFKDRRRSKTVQHKNRLVQRVARRDRQLRFLQAQASRTAHDLKAPLVAMKGYVDMMLRGMAGPINDQMRRYLERIGAAVDRQKALIDSSVPARSWRWDEAIDLASALERLEGLTRPIGPVWVAGAPEALDGLVAELEGLGPRAVVVDADEFRIHLAVTVRLRVAKRRVQRLTGWASRLGGTVTTEGRHVKVCLPAFTPR